MMLLLLFIHLLPRSNEIVNIKVNDIQGKTLVVPMTKRNFIEPHSPQVKQVIDYAISLKRNSDNPYLFEGRFINSTTINFLLIRSRFKVVQTAHGYRAMGRTW